jgi:hypothetical protein
LNADEHDILDEDLTPDDMTIIGTKTFDYDDAMLNEHVAHTLEWWYGNRNPRGVSLEQSSRCLSVVLIILDEIFCSLQCRYLVHVNMHRAASGGNGRHQSFGGIGDVVNDRGLCRASNKLKYMRVNLKWTVAKYRQINSFYNVSTLTRTRMYDGVVLS